MTRTAPSSIPLRPRVAMPSETFETKSPRWQYIFLSVTTVIALTILLLFIPSQTDLTRIEQRPTNLTTLTLQEVLEPAPTIPSTRYDYNLANILNIQSYTSVRRHDPLNHHLIQREASARRRSIIARYAESRSQCTVTPSITRLRQAVRSYFYRYHRIEHPAIRDKTLVIHHDPAELDLPFVQIAIDLAKSFERVRLLVPDRRLQKRLVGTHTIMHRRDASDDTVAFMFVASHLLVHTGATSALGALVTMGTVYHTAALSEYTSQSAFKWLLKNRVPLSPEKVSQYVPSLNFMGRVKPTCCELKPFGEGDEEKIVCGNTADFTPPCWVLAVGSAGLFGFERDVVNKTACHVHTFDCTGNWDVPSDIADRVTLHKLCLGAENHGLFRTLEELIRIGSRELPGTNNLTMPAFTKMDIEGYEFPVIRALVEGTDEVLPQQIAMEVHQNTILPVGPPYIPTESEEKRSYVTDETIQELFANLSKKGYDLVHRADNPFCSLCSEVTVVRRSVLPKE